MKQPIKITVHGGKEAAHLADALHCLNGSQSEGNRQCVVRMFAESEINTEWVDTNPPAPVLVPLGPNRTRNNHKVIVHAIDGPSPGLPVVASMKGDDGHWRSYNWPADGIHPHGQTGSDLVGHLPPAEPESVKPREWWVNIYQHQPEFFDSKEQADEAACKDRKECRHVREVIPGEQDELEAMRRWKKDMLTVENEWDIQAVGKELGLTLGTKIRPAILPKIRGYKELLQRTLEGISPGCRLAEDIRKALNLQP
jgi:hypothetical protein